jgi:dihydrofolate reductase
VTFVARRPADLLDDVAREGRQRLWLVGGGELAGAFQAEGLITRYIISVIPVMLGSGVPLFAPGPETVRPLRLVWQRAYPNGLVQLRYVR